MIPALISICADASMSPALLRATKSGSKRVRDGGLPVEGIARVLGSDEWVDLAKTHLLTDGE